MGYTYADLQSLQLSTDAKLQTLYNNANPSTPNLMVYSTLLWVILATIVLYYIFFKL